MKQVVKMALKTLIISIILVTLLSSTALANGSADGIEVSPNVINLDSNGGSFSIHTDIGYSKDYELFLEAHNANGVVNTIYILGSFSDSRGDLVVKFDPRDENEEYLISVGEVTFYLTVTLNGIDNTYSDKVKVISFGK